ncbi:MAG: PTS fructose transporter subunit IIA [Verrucomicrobia bacterium]|nr:MAG: PTS fructose transporter subunit IIA [Verrucomicrobiota bacterium]
MRGMWSKYGCWPLAHTRGSVRTVAGTRPSPPQQFLYATGCEPKIGVFMKSNDAVVLSKMLSPAAINLNLKSGDRESVLAELVDQIPQLAREPEARQTLLRALHEREQLHSTGIGDGIALPHARNALVGLVDEPIMVFGRHATGIPYDAIDKIPARLFFLLVAPTVTQHLGILARLSRLLREPKLRQALLTAERPEKVVGLIKEAEGKT